MKETKLSRLALRHPFFSTWLAIAAVTLITTGSKAEWPLIRHRTVNKHIVGELGHIGYFAIEVKNAISGFVADSKLRWVDATPYREFLSNIHSANTIAPDGNELGKHVIYIQLESVDGIAVRSSYQGEPVMPFLSSLRQESIDLANHLDNSDAGRTTDGEFLALASVPPLKDIPIFVTRDLSDVPALPKVLNRAGYLTQSLHGFDSHFWNRKNAHAQLGYRESYYIEDLDRSDSIGWGVSDYSVLQQSAALIEPSDRPVFNHTILLTNHHPYQHVGKKFGHQKATIEENHIDSLRYVDDSIQSFFKRLEERGILEDCLIIIYSDHDSGIENQLRNVVTLDEDVYPDTLPAILYGFSEAPLRVEKATGHQDIPVIVLKELGLPIPRSFTGNALQSDLPTYHPKFGTRRIVDGELISSDSPISLDTFTKLVLHHPKKLEGGE